MENKKVSIIVPIYNVEKYLERCIVSILNQTYQNIEINLVDDGSEDNCGDICDKFAEKDCRIKVYHKQNEGVSVARNMALDNCSGDFIAFIDADDYILPTYIETLLEGILDTNTELSIVDYYIETDKQRVVNSVYDNSFEKYSIKELLENIYEEEKYMGYLWNKLFVKKVIDKYHLRFFPNIKIWEDLLFCCQYIDRINYGIYVHKPLYVYYQRANSTVNNNTSKKEPTKIIALNEIYKVAQNYNGTFLKSTEILYSNILVAALYSKEWIAEIADVMDMDMMVSKIESMKKRLSIKHIIMYNIAKHCPHVYHCIIKNR